MSLPERPALLHALPVVNLFALLWMFHFAGASLTSQAGVTVDPPPSRFQLERFRETLVVTLVTAESGARIYLGRELVDMATLESRLESLRGQGAASRTIVLLQCDADTQVGAEREVGELILGKGFRLALTGSNGGGAESQKEISK
jgi:biopolymer transport protein ExbD